MLEEKNLPLTGLTFCTLPNIEWILRAIKFIDLDSEHETVLGTNLKDF